MAIMLRTTRAHLSITPILSKNIYSINRRLVTTKTNVSVLALRPHTVVDTEGISAAVNAVKAECYDYDIPCNIIARPYRHVHDNSDAKKDDLMIVTPAAADDDDAGETITNIALLIRVTHHDHVNYLWRARNWLIEALSCDIKVLWSLSIRELLSIKAFIPVVAEASGTHIEILSSWEALEDHNDDDCNVDIEMTGQWDGVDNAQMELLALVYKLADMNVEKLKISKEYHAMLRKMSFPAEVMVRLPDVNCSADVILLAAAKKNRCALDDIIFAMRSVYSQCSKQIVAKIKLLTSLQSEWLRGDGYDCLSGISIDTGAIITFEDSAMVTPTANIVAEALCHKKMDEMESYKTIKKVAESSSGGSDYESATTGNDEPPYDFDPEETCILIRGTHVSVQEADDILSARLDGLTEATILLKSINSNDMTWESDAEYIFNTDVVTILLQASVLNRATAIFDAKSNIVTISGEYNSVRYMLDGLQAIDPEAVLTPSPVLAAAATTIQYMNDGSVRNGTNAGENRDTVTPKCSPEIVVDTPVTESFFSVNYTAKADVFEEYIRIEQTQLEYLFRSCGHDGVVFGQVDRSPFDGISRVTHTVISVVPPDSPHDDDSRAPKKGMGNNTRKVTLLLKSDNRDNITRARELISILLRTHAAKVTLKLDIPREHHVNIIGKRGATIQSVMKASITRIHFPDGKRNRRDKNSQVSICGRPDSIEVARLELRSLVPYSITFDVTCSSEANMLNEDQPLCRQLCTDHGLTMFCRNKGCRNGVSSQVITIKALSGRSNELKAATAILMEHAGVLGNDVTLQVDIPHHLHLAIIGKGGVGIKNIMTSTNCHIRFPDLNAQLRSDRVFITGTIDGTDRARLYLLGELPVVLKFDIPNSQKSPESEDASIEQCLQLFKVAVSFVAHSKGRTVILRCNESNMDGLLQARAWISGLPVTESNPPLIASSCSVSNGEQHSAADMHLSLLKPPVDLQQRKNLWLQHPNLDPVPSILFSSTWPPRLHDHNGFCDGSLKESTCGHDIKTASHKRLPPGLGPSLSMNNLRDFSNNEDPTPTTHTPLRATKSAVLFQRTAKPENLYDSYENMENQKLNNHMALPTALSHRQESDPMLLCQIEHTPMDKSNKDILKNSEQYIQLLRNAEVLMNNNKKVTFESERTPTDAWSGFGFSRSMPAIALSEIMEQKQRANTELLKQQQELLQKQQQQYNVDVSLLSTSSSCLYNSSNAYDFQLQNDSNEPAFRSPYPSTSARGCSPNSISSDSMPKPNSVGPVRPPHLDCSDVNGVLDMLGLAKYKSLFEEQEVDLSTFYTLTEEDLRELGVTTFGARRKILLAITQVVVYVHHYSGADKDSVTALASALPSSSHQISAYSSAFEVSSFLGNKLKNVMNV